MFSFAHRATRWVSSKSCFRNCGNTGQVLWVWQQLLRRQSSGSSPSHSFQVVRETAPGLESTLTTCARGRLPQSKSCQHLATSKSSPRAGLWPHDNTPTPHARLMALMPNSTQLLWRPQSLEVLAQWLGLQSPHGRWCYITALLLQHKAFTLCPINRRLQIYFIYLQDKVTGQGWVWSSKRNLPSAGSFLTWPQRLWLCQAVARSIFTVVSKMSSRCPYICIISDAFPGHQHEPGWWMV